MERSEELATDEDLLLEFTKFKTLEQLATDEYSSVRCRVAQNPNTPTKVLEQLATDEDSDVRYWVARHPNTPPKTLEQLATDEEWSVRWWVARHPNTPHYVKKSLKFQRYALFHARWVTN